MITAELAHRRRLNSDPELLEERRDLLVACSLGEMGENRFTVRHEPALADRFGHMAARFCEQSLGKL
jgi:hypothetical protein